jgi:hypothetical protein
MNKLEQLEKNKQNVLYNYESHCAATNSAMAELNYCQRAQAKAFELLMNATKELDRVIANEIAEYYLKEAEL